MEKQSVYDYVPRDTTVTGADSPLLQRFIEQNSAKLNEWFDKAFEESVILNLNDPEERCLEEGMPMIVYAEVTWDHVPEEDRVSQLENARKAHQEHTAEVDRTYAECMETYYRAMAEYQELKDADPTFNEAPPVLPVKGTTYPEPQEPAPDFRLQRTILNDTYVVDMVKELTAEGYTDEERFKLAVYVRYIAMDSARRFAGTRFMRKEMEENPPIRLDVNQEELEAEMAALEVEDIAPSDVAEV